MAKKDNNNMNEDPVIITLDDKQFRASELNDHQKVLAFELHGIHEEMRQLETKFDKLNRDKNYRILDFQNSLNVTEEVEEEK